MDTLGSFQIERAIRAKSGKIRALIGQLASHHGVSKVVGSWKNWTKKPDWGDWYKGGGSPWGDWRKKK